MTIIKNKVDIDKLKTIEAETFFEDMIKAVVDIEQEIIRHAIARLDFQELEEVLQIR